MAFAQIAPLFPLVIAPLFGGLAIWSALRMRAVHRERGRRQIEQAVARRGETLVAIENLPFSALRMTPGLSSTLIFRVLASGPNGDRHAYEWAYEPRVFPWQSEGLKRCAHGIWIALA
jgi:hypothetical protein